VFGPTKLQNFTTQPYLKASSDKIMIQVTLIGLP
jgi:hypothetical protein